MVLVKVQVETGPRGRHQALGYVREIRAHGCYPSWGTGHHVHLVGGGAGLAWVGMRGQVTVGGIPSTPSSSSSWNILTHGSFSLHVHIVVWGRHGGWRHLVLKGGGALDTIACRIHHVRPGMAVVIMGAWDGAPWRLRLELQRLPRNIVAHHGAMLLHAAWITLLLGSRRVHGVGWVVLGRPAHWVSHGRALGCT